MLGREINGIILFEALKNFALTLIGVFIPIYIISQGFDLYYAGLFIIISGFTGVFLSYPIARLVSRIGFKHGLVLSYLFILPGIILVQQIKLSLGLIVFTSVFYNIGRTFHNICANSEFAVDSDEKKRGRDSGKMLSLPNISRVIAPLIGGAVFAKLGFGTLVAISVFFLLMSVIPLVFSTEHRDPMDYSMLELLREEDMTGLPLFTIRGIQSVTAVGVFSLFIYLIVGGSIDVGWARTVNSLGFVATGLITGRIIDRYGAYSSILIGTIGAALIHLLRIAVSMPFHAFAVSFMGGIFFQIYHVPLYSKFADSAEKEDILEYYTLRKIFVSVGNIITIGTLLLFFTYFGPQIAFYASFILASFATLMMAVFSQNL